MVSACREEQDRKHATLNRPANWGAPIPGPSHAPATSRRGLARVLAPYVANLPAPEWPFLACEADVHWPNRMVSEVMQAIVVEKLGGPEELQMQEWPVPSPAPGEIRVDVDVAGVNLMDAGARPAGAANGQPPFAPGVEGAGRGQRPRQRCKSLLRGRR